MVLAALCFQVVQRRQVNLDILNRVATVVVYKDPQLQRRDQRRGYLDGRAVI